MAFQEKSGGELCIDSYFSPHSHANSDCYRSVLHFFHRHQKVNTWKFFSLLMVRFCPVQNCDARKQVGFPSHQCLFLPADCSDPFPEAFHMSF
ncbi:hypothetical protein ES708_25330 [subsurface metagenome]